MKETNKQDGIREITCSRQDRADLFYYSAQRIDQLFDQGVVKKESRGKYLAWESIHGLIQYRETKKKNQHDSEDGDYEIQRTRLTKAKADVAEMQAAILKGTVHEAKAVELVWTDHLLACRAKLLAMPKKLAPRLHGQEKLPTIETEIETAIYEALNELASYDPAIVTDRYVEAHRLDVSAEGQVDSE
jgi:phage terminase Nu1 subunit (DNA packaging protein)